MRFRYQIACSAGILLGQVNIKKHMMVYSSSHVWFGFDLIWWGVGVRKGKIFTPPPHLTPLFFFFFYCCSPPWYKFLSFPSLLLPLKAKMVVIIFAKKILSTCLPKLWLLWLQARYQTSSSVIHINRILHDARGNKFHLWVLIVSFTWVWKTPKNRRK